MVAAFVVIVLVAWALMRSEAQESMPSAADIPEFSEGKGVSPANN